MATTTTTTATKQPSGPCATCGTTCTLRCARCQVCFVCRKACLVSFWPAHKAFCQQVAKVANVTDGTKCLVVEGPLLGRPNSTTHTKGVQRALLEAGLDAVVVIDVTKGQQLPEQVAALLRQSSQKAPNAMLLLGWGSGDDSDIETAFATSVAFRQAAQTWCRAGGRFLVQGERISVMGDWPRWFGLEWSSGDMDVRTDHACFATGDDESAVHWWKDYPKAEGAVTGTYNVKACMVTNVEPEDALFGTTEYSKSQSKMPGHSMVTQGRSIGAGQVAIALARCEKGTVSFFCDMNFEDDTLRIMAVVARGK